ncbi:endonuclease III domain-containing protein [Methylonatrum kenyense]|uniref:endonuclease III domain-containing protein n=1 Tax=Methylonatrum kenyense TaxID=455253 RepID=UPI0020BD5D9F|nr:endonuclease III domain-containing protein [Methylonatrum kenyense]
MADVGQTGAAGVYWRLREYFGHRNWWPADDPFEILVGAILTQNTAWTNVEKAMARLREQGRLNPGALLDLPEPQLAELIRSSGYYNIKASRLRALLSVLREDGGLDGWRDHETAALRARLLAVRGVGEETADSILLYALGRPVFVIDAYTRRIFSRLGLVSGDESYRELAEWFERQLTADVDLYQDFHAQIVTLGNGICRPAPRCEQCPLAAGCPQRGIQPRPASARG